MRTDRFLSLEDSHSYITNLLSQLKDFHSHLITKHDDAIRYLSKPTTPTSSVFESSRGNVGYIDIPSFVDTKELPESMYIESVRRCLDGLFKSDLMGLTLDLRNNSGGNMWPMLAGLAEILNGPVVGYFLDKHNRKNAWRVDNGAALIGDQIVARSDYLLRSVPLSKIPTACLISETTCSSGEAIVVAVKGRENTRLYGHSTSGSSTANEGFQLPCGAMLWLTTSIFMDRNHVLYGGVINPDIVVNKSVPDNVLFEDIARWMCEINAAE